jgi:isopentenyl diphosphate isomerase/L-lactate dehydrogenase-like FMN-dependent dehydrogenase
LLPVNVSDYERLAAEMLDTGVAGYFNGGAGDERTLRANVAALERIKLRPRVLVDVSNVQTATSVLGTPISMPLLIAPFALQSMLHPDRELATAQAAAAAGTIFTLSTIATARPSELAATGGPRWLQVYVFRDRGITRAIVDEAVEAGFSALALTVDAPRSGRRERDIYAGFHVSPQTRVPCLQAALGDARVNPTIADVFDLLDRSLTWADFEQLAGEVALPLIVKGIQTGEDARLACEHGAAAIIVSNHGGRQLDDVAATIDLLPEIVEAVDGRVEVLVDGGIRRGIDVLKALALGAQAALIGRPAAWALAVDGQRGVTHLLELLAAEIELGMTLLGVTSPSEITASHVQR